MSFEPGTTHQPVDGGTPVSDHLAVPPRVDNAAALLDHSVRQEIESFLAGDTSRLGDVYRGLKRGMTADEIAADLGVATPKFVWNHSRTISALVEGDLPTAPTVALQTARRFRTALKLGNWSTATRERLLAGLAELERRAEDGDARAAEDQNAIELTQRAESKNEVGIYVYALPHYLRYPFDPKSGRTLMKVGRSGSDVIQRFRNQTRTTALPEEPILLRIYPAETETTTLERRFHSMLEAADHDRSVARSAGKEWFVTSTKFLDALARLMDLPVEIVNDAEIADDL